MHRVGGALRPTFRLTTAEATTTRRAINLRHSVLGASRTLWTGSHPVKHHSDDVFYSCGHVLRYAAPPSALCVRLLWPCRRGVASDGFTCTVHTRATPEEGRVRKASYNRDLSSPSSSFYGPCHRRDPGASRSSMPPGSSFEATAMRTVQQGWAGVAVNPSEGRQ